MSDMPTDRDGRQKEIEIVKKFADFGLHVQPEALELLTQHSFEINEIAECITNSFDPSIFVISPKQIAQVIKKREANDEEKKTLSETQRHPIAPAPALIRSFCDQGKGVDHKDFLPHFIDRYKRISGILNRRINCGQIRFVKNRRGGEEFSVVGMVSSVHKTAKGNTRVDLEDPTGTLPVIITHQEELIPDEIIGVTGFFSDGGYLIANRVVYPDVPIHHLSSQSALPPSAKEDQEPIHAVFISDMHVGSTTFLTEVWESLMQWLRENAEPINIGYLVVAGDIVDGIGVYPGQEEDLSITDINEQYKIAAGYFHELPPRIHLVIAPGNHDAVRSAEPQPPLPDDLQRLFPTETCFVSSPSYIKIGGRVVLIYHGQSYDDFVNSVSRLSYSQPAEVMVEMLRRRHVAPIYGTNVPIIPNGYDYGVIDLVPDIFHCGHTHTVGISKYRDVLLINSGTWQAQTPYQKKRNIVPIPGCATLVELAEMKTKVMDFRAA
jgi:DNA polymerase II small subunit